MSDAILKVSNVSSYYGEMRAIEDMSLEVRRGEIVAIVGANGAGKTTLMKSIAGLVSPKSGNIVFEGEDITGTPANAIIRKGISYVPEGRRLFANLSVRENLELGAVLRSGEKLDDDYDRVHTLFPGCSNAAASSRARCRVASSRWSRWAGR